jgi:hypothetical protein
MEVVTDSQIPLALSSKGNIMPSENFDLYKLYLATAEAISERRAKMNSWMMSINSGLVGIYAAIQKLGVPPAASRGPVWVWALGLTGIIVCVAWLSLIGSYRALNKAKFEVIQELEKSMAIRPFTLEREKYKFFGRWSFGDIETCVPLAMSAVYLVVLIGLVS